jgi:hypothetical protein
MKTAAPIPEFILNIDGVEFHNIRKAQLQDYDLPGVRTAHLVFWWHRKGG